jgi:sulfopyruvate decarboxylase beta subunit
MKRYEAMEVIVSSLSNKELVISANGFISRDLYSIEDSSQHFYMLGSMGLASSIGLGLSLSIPDRRIIVIDGDGNILMNLGSLATIGHLHPKNFVHIVLDNESHESTGGQPTASHTTKLEKMAAAAGYKTIKKVSDAGSLKNSVATLLESEGPVFILVKIEKGKKDVARISIAPEDIKKRFMSIVESKSVPMKSVRKG